MRNAASCAVPGGCTGCAPGAAIACLTSWPSSNCMALVCLTACLPAAPAPAPTFSRLTRPSSATRPPKPAQGHPPPRHPATHLQEELSVRRVPAAMLVEEAGLVWPQAVTAGVMWPA